MWKILTKPKTLKTKNSRENRQTTKKIGRSSKFLTIVTETRATNVCFRSLLAINLQWFACHSHFKTSLSILFGVNDELLVLEMVFVQVERLSLFLDWFLLLCQFVGHGFCTPIWFKSVQSSIFVCVRLNCKLDVVVQEWSCIVLMGQIIHYEYSFHANHHNFRHEMVHISTVWVQIKPLHSTTAVLGTNVRNPNTSLFHLAFTLLPNKLHPVRRQNINP